MNHQPRIATVGMFDGVHRGHCALLDRLRREASVKGASPVVFTFDRHPLAHIAPERAPGALMTVSDKVDALKSTGIEDIEVLHFDEKLRSLTARQFLTMLHDDFGITALLMGFNHRFGSDRLDDLKQYEAIGQEIGIEIVRADELRDPAELSRAICSSSIREAIAEGDVTAAAKMLGRPFALRGKVVHGRQLGRTIGFPTANIEPSESALLVPRRGVYAVDVVLPGGERRRGMLNIGVRPTVDNSARPVPSVEVYIIDWHGDLYDKEIELEFIKRLRDERRFSDLDALRRQLALDLEETKSL